MQIKFLDKAPDSGSVVYIDREVLNKVSCIMVDGVALAFNEAVVETAVPVPSLPMLAPPAPEVIQVTVKESKAVDEEAEKPRPITAKIFRKLRGARSQEEWGKKFGISNSTVARLEKGERVYKKTANLIERVLGRPLDGSLLSIWED